VMSDCDAGTGCRAQSPRLLRLGKAPPVPPTRWVQWDRHPPHRPPRIDTNPHPSHPPRMNAPRPVARYWLIILWAAAAYNFIIGVSGLFAAGASAQAQVMSLLVACFGLLYAMVARDPVRLGPALWSGVVGKIGVVAIMLPPVLSGKLPGAIGAVLAGDVLFTLLFLTFLLRRG
jgi:hypothetical protein